MQQRAAAVSVAIFLLLASGSYAFIGVAEQPSLTLENPDYTVAANDTVELGGTTYTFTEVTATAATAQWTNESARQTATLEADQNVTYQGDNYTVSIPNATGNQSNPESFELREVQTVDRPTSEVNGTTYVVFDQGNNRTLVPVDEYLPNQTVHQFGVGDQIEYQNNTTTVAAITSSAVTLEWFAPEQKSVQFSEGENTTVNDVAYLAHFDQSEEQAVLELTTDYRDYKADVDAQNYFHERVNGLWGVVILSSLAAILLAMFAYMPSRY